jgi:hypothetical protein
LRKDQNCANNIIRLLKSKKFSRRLHKNHKEKNSIWHTSQSAESTKVHIVYDASAKANDDSLSLNDCLQRGSALQNLLWNILVRNRFKPLALAADLKQAFLQIGIKEKDRDALRFHWIEGDPREIDVYQFTCALF